MDISFIELNVLIGLFCCWEGEVAVRAATVHHSFQWLSSVGNFIAKSFANILLITG